jgi:hypothetical protein
MRLAEHPAVRGAPVSGVPPDEAFKIAAGNMLDFFHLGDTPMGKRIAQRSG